ncbi:MAG TPA: haloacid dehalogenase-like hydrolase, partial [Rudaea sp.]|nr:haloacid dehalogenase-like hydrolase [Rudaea sp.]
MSYFIAGPIARIGQRLPGGTWKKIVTRNAARETVAADGGRLAFDNYETQCEDLIPLVVDLDGTLLKSDSLIEGFVSLLSTRPVAALWTLAALRRGKAAFKAAVAREAKIDIVGLPWNEAVLELVRAARAAGRKVYIASASDRSLVEAMARHLGLFDGTFCSDGAVNLSGRAKSRALCAAFGAGGFDYAGNSQIDCAVWECARNVIVVDAPRTLVTKVRRRWPGARVIARQGGGLKTYLRAIRVHQWLKNGLIFVPMLAAKQFGAHELANSALAFLSFSLCASAVYVMNDLIDLSRDRAHATKRTRPFAAGTLPVTHGLALAPL